MRKLASLLTLFSIGLFAAGCTKDETPAPAPDVAPNVEGGGSLGPADDMPEDTTTDEAPPTTDEAPPTTDENPPADTTAPADATTPAEGQTPPAEGDNATDTTPTPADASTTNDTPAEGNTPAETPNP